MALTISALPTNMVKALVFDVTLTIGLVGINFNSFQTAIMLTHVFTGAFTAYTLRDIARDNKYPVMGGIIAGAIKYATKDSNPFYGAYNNGAYEFAKKAELEKGGLEVVVIEGIEEMIASSLKAYHDNGTVTEVMTAGTNGALFGGIVVGGTLVGIGALFFNPLHDAAMHLPDPAVGLIAIAALTDCGYTVGTKLGNTIVEYYDEYLGALVNNVTAYAEL